MSGPRAVQAGAPACTALGGIAAAGLGVPEAAGGVGAGIVFAAVGDCGAGKCGALGRVLRRLGHTLRSSRRQPQLDARCSPARDLCRGPPPARLLSRLQGVQPLGWRWVTVSRGYHHGHEEGHRVEGGLRAGPAPCLRSQGGRPPEPCPQKPPGGVPCRGWLAGPGDTAKSLWGQWQLPGARPLVAGPPPALHSLGLGVAGGQGLQGASAFHPQLGD